MVEYSDDRPLVAPLGPNGFPVLQVDRLDAVVKHALNSENWDQRSWMTMHSKSTACGTTYCLAGFAAVEFAGLEPVLDAYAEPFIDDVYVEDGDMKSISAVARDYLGLTSDESIDLFDSSNEYADVIEITKKIKSGEYR